VPYSVVINRSAERELKAQSPDVAHRVGERLRALADDPRPVQSIRLKGSKSYRIRVGDYRVVYSIDDDARVVTVVAIGHRSQIYRDL
jgi:mRNA interferase RelE/StbE